MAGKSVILGAVGDIDLSGASADAIRANGFDWPFARLMPAMGQADVLFGNLEASDIENLNTADFEKGSGKALANNILYVPGEICYAVDPTRPRPNHEMRLSFGNATEAGIREGIARLGAVLRKLI